jgi:catechol 2,3-dioxygenase-like lactoylglutathione lyase family enzyme
VQGQEKITEHTLKLGPGAKSPPATLADMAWLTGRWVGPALGGEAEEIWSPPRAGSMMGMYRLVRDGKPVFYEFQTLVEVRGSLILRLKHFNPDLIGWEEKQKTIEFPLVGLQGGIIQFEGMSFHRQGDARLTVYLAIEGKDGAVHEEAFSYTRALPERQSGEEKQMRLGNFSVSLAARDISASRAFYEKLGFRVIMGDQAQNWLILQNETSTIGLFQGVYSKNIMTFNPGWDRNGGTLADFDDVRDIQRMLKAQGLRLTTEADEATSGPASLMLVDPDGNQILVDQHVPSPRK